jgi:polyphosphate kinase
MKKDYLIYFPEVSFNSYLNLIEEATNNPLTQMIFITIYRIGSSEAIYNLLAKAVKRGITSIVNIELNAYGEKINKEWEIKMQKAGIVVLNYGKDHFKIHSKLTLILFKSGKMITQIGTGNYHTETTKQYTDLCYFTSNHKICESALSLINIFQQKSKKFKKNKHFLVTRYNFKNKIIKLIRRETKLREKGYIGIKCNSFDDEELFEYLEKARLAGCRIDLIVRGICTWIPDFINSNVTIKSVIWDKLEHSRIFWFGRDFSNIFIGSLDPVKRKINNRIELLVEVLSPEIKMNIKKYFNSYFNDYKHSWYMNNDGEYIQID